MQRRSHWPVVLLSTISTIFGVFLPLILVRIITPEEVGHFKIFFLYLTLLPALTLTVGITNGLAYWAGQDEKGIRAVKTSALLLLSLGILATSIALYFRQYIAGAFGWSSDQAGLFAYALLGTIAAGFFEEAAIAKGKTWTGALFYSGFELLRTLAILIALFLYRDLTALLWAHTIVVTVKLISGFIYGYYLNLVSLIFDPPSLRAVWKYAFPVSLAWVFGIFVASADQFVLSSTISASQFAIYSIGCLSIAPLIMFEHSVTRVLIPQMSEAFSQKQPSRAAILYQSAVENLSFILIPAVVGLIIFAVPIIEICFTKQYSAAAKYLQWYALTYLFLIIPYDALARARGQTGWILKTFVIFSIFSLSLAILLANLAGPMGALSAILITGASMRIYAIMYFQQQTLFKYRAFLPFASFFKYLVVSCTLALFALLLRKEFSEGSSWFFTCGSAFALLYLAIALPIKNRSEHTRQPSRGLLILTQTLNIGGLERMVLHLCENIKSEKQWAVHVLAYDQSGSSSEGLLPEFEAKNIPVEAFRKPNGFSLLVIVKILRNIFRNDIQIIHSQDLGSLLYASIVKICCFAKVSIVHTQHSFVHLGRAKRYQMYEKCLTFFIDKLCVVSEDTRQTYRGMGVNDEKIHLIENGVAFLPNPIVSRSQRTNLRQALLQVSQKNNPTLAAHSKDIWILYMARIFPGKGQEHAIELWNQLKPELRQNSILCFVGPEAAEGEYARIGALINKAKDPSRLFMLGASNNPQQWLSTGDIYLSCSEFEGMPLGPLEAVGSGLPTLLSKIAGHDFLQSCSSQFTLTDKIDGAGQLENIMTRIAEEGEEYFKQLWLEGSHLREKYSVERMSKKYSIIYSDICATPSSLSEFGESYGYK